MQARAEAGRAASNTDYFPTTSFSKQHPSTRVATPATRQRLANRLKEAEIRAAVLRKKELEVQAEAAAAVAAEKEAAAAVEAEKEGSRIRGQAALAAQAAHAAVAKADEQASATAMTVREKGAVAQAAAALQPALPCVDTAGEGAARAGAPDAGEGRHLVQWTSNGAALYERAVARREQSALRNVVEAMDEVTQRTERERRSSIAAVEAARSLAARRRVEAESAAVAAKAAVVGCSAAARSPRPARERPRCSPRRRQAPRSRPTTRPRSPSASPEERRSLPARTACRRRRWRWPGRPSGLPPRPTRRSRREAAARRAARRPSARPSPPRRRQRRRRWGQRR